MFGLTKREQRWAAEQKAAEVIASVLVAKMKTDANERAVKAEAKVAELEAGYDNNYRAMRDAVLQRDQLAELLRRAVKLMDEKMQAKGHGCTYTAREMYPLIDEICTALEKLK